jgi:hypothetical protein
MRTRVRFGLRLFLGFIFLTAGMGKLTHGHFPGFIGPIQLEDELAKHHLGLYGRFIALSQVGIGWLLLSQRFALLGSIMLVPMLANILMVTIALEWRGTPYVNGFLLTLNLGLLWLDRARLVCLLDRDSQDSAPLEAGAPAWGAPEWLWLAGAAAVLAGGALGRSWWPAAYLGVALGIAFAVSVRRIRGVS